MRVRLTKYWNLIFLAVLIIMDFSLLIFIIGSYIVLLTILSLVSSLFLINFIRLGKQRRGKKLLKSSISGGTNIFLIIAEMFFGMDIIFHFTIIINPPFVFTPIGLLLIVYGITFLLAGMMNYLTYITVYENGVKVRKSRLVPYLIPRFIPFEQIEDVTIDKVKVRKKKIEHALTLQLKNDAFSIELNWIKNHKDIYQELTKAISFHKTKKFHNEIPINTTNVKFIKQEFKYSGRFGSSLIWTFPEDGSFQVTCHGSGSHTNPVIIDDSLILPNRISIKDYNLYFIFNSLHLKRLYLEHCENFSFSECEIDLIRMISCKNLLFVNCSVPRDLKLKECQNVTFENDLIRKQILFKSSSINLKNCIVIRLTSWMSKSNVYESNNIKFLRSNVKQDTFIDKNKVLGNNIRNQQFQVKKLFFDGPKSIIRNIPFWALIAYIIFTVIWLLIFAFLIENGYDVILWVMIFPFQLLFFVAFMIFTYLIHEYYYKFTFRRLKKR
jgi:hypothetical protein